MSVISLVIDLIVVAIIAVAVLISVKRGFVKSAVELAGFVLAVVLALTCSSPLATLTYDKFIKESVETTVRDSITNAVGDVAEDIDMSAFEDVWDALPDFFTNNSDEFGISKEEVKNDLISVDTTQVENAAVEIADSVARPVLTTILEAAIALLIFFIVSSLAKLLSGPLNKLFSISVIGKINKLLGGILGVIQGVIWSCAICSIICLIVSFTPNGFLIFTPEAIETTYLFKIFGSVFSLF